MANALFSLTKEKLMASMDGQIAFVLEAAALTMLGSAPPPPMESFLTQPEQRYVLVHRKNPNDRRRRVWWSKVPRYEPSLEQLMEEFKNFGMIGTVSGKASIAFQDFAKAIKNAAV